MMSTPPEQSTYIVCFHRDGHLDVFTVDHYHANLDTIKFSTAPDEPGYYLLQSVDAVNEATAVAIAVASQLNQQDRGSEPGIINRLIHAYLEAKDWKLNSVSDVRPDELQYLDKAIAERMDDPNRDSPFANTLRVLSPDPYDRKEVAVEWVSDRDTGLIKIARPDGSDRAYARTEASIPNGWVLGSEVRLRSPGQMELEIK